MRFVGRSAEFSRLDAELARVEKGQARFVVVRGRRQVGKSRLLTEWLRRRDRPHVYYQALDKPIHQELESFRDAVARSSLEPIAGIARTGVSWSSWDSALAVLEYIAAPGRHDGSPGVIVIDELPCILRNDPSFEATLQAAWDHQLQRAGLLLIVVGSDLAMMDALTSYGRPLYSRVDTELRVEPLNVCEAAELLDLGAREAFDTYLMTGGFPKVLAARAEHSTTSTFLNEAVADEAHPLVYTGQRMLDAEFPPSSSSRSVLGAIGHGERTFGHIRNRTGLSERSLVNSLNLLKEKRVIAAEDPQALRVVRRRTRYRVADPYLRFWLSFLAERVDDIARGRGDLVAADVEAGWQKYSGEAVEPLVRASIERILPDERFGAARYVGSYWGRDNHPQVDLIGTEKRSGSSRLSFVGSIKWRATKPFTARDVVQLGELAQHLPGWSESTARVGVSRLGFEPGADLDATLSPEDLIAAWR
ncbi:ATP-binding protein [Phytoactinopolyspora halotolerans]|uniref:AAA family ATPase n=1 Tax=Phytoactinopolyspora halotolerans TaxID=1981512 RepID=A0A6L9SH73_9ACTN|nr:ATP-binding protein [Phytoactinopolyspora halotolerans]NEE03772.1 AAA family ATPase [Phytoactinopolyspora halotolerans]